MPVMVFWQAVMVGMLCELRIPQSVDLASSGLRYFWGFFVGDLGVFNPTLKLLIFI